jgi:hypothetical protein
MVMPIRWMQSLPVADSSEQVLSPEVANDWQTLLVKRGRGGNRPSARSLWRGIGDFDSPVVSEEQVENDQSFCKCVCK